MHWFTIRLLEERVVNLWEAVFIQWKVILLTGEWGREGEEWKWTRSQAHNDKVSGLWGSRTSPAEGAQESHCQI